MKTVHILLAHDSLAGILSAVSAAYRSRYGHANIKICMENEQDTMELFASYIPVPVDETAAMQVYRAIYEKIGMEAGSLVENAALSTYPERAEVIYRFLILGFANGARTLHYLSDQNVMRLHEIARNVRNESCHWQEFLRFNVHELRGGHEAEGAQVSGDLPIPLGGQLGRKLPQSELLTAVITPRHRVITYIMPHFADRFSYENFIVLDETHDMAGMHLQKEEWFTVSDFSEQYPDFLPVLQEADSSERQMQELWKIFFRATDIPERANASVQRNLLPLWFRKNMTEFQSPSSQ